MLLQLIIDRSPIDCVMAVKFAVKILSASCRNSTLTFALCLFMFVLAKNRCKFVNYCIVIEKQISVIVIYSMQAKQFYCDCLTDLFQFGTFKLSANSCCTIPRCLQLELILFFYSFLFFISLFLTLNIQISHPLQIARLIEAGGVWTA